MEFKRDLMLLDAICMGLGAMVGTGLFVGLGLAAGLAGPAVLLSLVLAAGLAMCNGLSLAQLARNHPVSGGTYEYGYRLLHPLLGFSAGWLFVAAKTSSSAAAAWSMISHVVSAESPHLIKICASAVILLLVGVSLLGIKTSSQFNKALVVISLSSLMVFVYFVFPEIDRQYFYPFFKSTDLPGASFLGFAEATALMFVAFTGYGRIATLGEEISDPEQNIPRAIIFSVTFTLLLYLLIAAVSIGAVGSVQFSNFTTETSAPLEAIAIEMGYPWLRWIVGLGASAAIAGVLFNLLLGISRVFVAMARRGDLPPSFAKISKKHGVPVVATLLSGSFIIILLFSFDLRSNWSLSAFTVLAYYSITNLAALKLSKETRRTPDWVHILGLVGSLSLIWWIDGSAIFWGFSIIGFGLIYRLIFRASMRKKLD